MKNSIFTARIRVAAVALGLLFAMAGCREAKEPAISVSSEEFLIGDQAGNIPLTIRSNASWTAMSNVPWCRLSQSSGTGTTDIELLVEALVSDQKRIAMITVATADGKLATVKVTQGGLTQTELRVSPTLITLGAKASSGNGFVVSTQYSDAVVDAAITSISGNWITGLTQTGADVDGYTRNVRFAFAAGENTGPVERTAVITVTVTFARATYTRQITVIQNGLGAPAISTPSTVYLGHHQIAFSQTIWVEGGDQTNVTYSCYPTSNSDGTASSPAIPWITSAWVDGTGTLNLSTLPNYADRAREGDVLIVASRDGVTTRLNVHVIQSGHLTPGADVPAAIIAHNYEAFTYTLPLNPTNDTQISYVSNNSGGWIYGVGVNAAGLMTYSLQQYTGDRGAYREATIMLMGANGHSNAVYYYVTVRQYAPGDAGISLPSTLVTYNAPGSGGATTMPLAALNGSTISQAGTSASWITGVSATNAALTYSVAPYNGADGPSRDAVITLQATNPHSNTAYYSITIRQYAPDAAGISLPVQTIAVNASLTSGTLPLVALNGSTINVVPGHNTAMVTTANVAGNNTLNYTVAAYDGSQGPVRETVITLSAANTHANTVYYQVVVRQYAPDAAGISLPVQVITVNASLTSGTLPLVALNGSTIDVVQPGHNTAMVTTANVAGNNTLNYTVAAYDGSQGTARETTITLKATNTSFNSTYYYVTVRQLAPAAAGISLPSTLMTYNASGSGGAATMPLAALNGSTISLVGASAGWLTGVSANNTTLTYTVAAYDGSQGPVRETTIMLQASNSNADAALYSILIRQYAPDAAGISLPVQVITVNASGVTGGTLPLAPLNGSTVNQASTSASWITGVSATTTALTYNVSPYTGADGSSREAVITLKATAGNGNFYDTYYYITVRQLAPAAAGISLPSTLVTYNAQGSGGAATMPLAALNGSTISLVGASAGWLTGVSANNTTLTYTVAAYDGSQGPVRETTITLRASNSNADAALYSILIRQYAPLEVGISLPAQTITAPAAGVAGLLPLNPLSGSTANVVATGYDATMLNPAPYVDGLGILHYTVTAFTGATGASRETTLTLQATRPGSVSTANYYITIRQNAPAAAGIGGLPAYLGFGSAGATGQTLYLNPLNGSTITLVSAPSWMSVNVEPSSTFLTYSVNPYSGSTVTDYAREGVLTLRAANTSANPVYYYINIRQTGTNMAYTSPLSVYWTWNAIYNMGVFSGAYGNYAPSANPVQTVALLNVPGPATIGYSTQGNAFFTIAADAPALNYTVTASSLAWGDVPPATQSDLLTITVNAPPYVQTLTVPVSARQNHLYLP
ncbi:hypothetical protein FACS1894159_09260 [Bacteroidia bacterium]|nr:hypothetical protein FACS1894159_09260 [Bacteroidia bacterium]